jgi:L-threonylcarbamoyladenylate synthase
MMQLRVVNPTDIDLTIIAEAAALIREGGLVAFPTETVYGLGADATNAEAVKRIFAAKGRPSYNPLIVHVPDVAAARAVVDDWPDAARILSTRFWPGPLTMVLRKRDFIPDVVSAGLPTVGVRVPAHPVAMALLRAAERPIAAPSANPSMRLSPTDGRHVAASMTDGPGLILDAGPVAVGIESTVIDLSSGIPTILRPGMIDRARISALIGEVRVASPGGDSDGARRSPGMLDRHYSPVARLVIASDSSTEAVVARSAVAGERVAVLTRSAFVSPTAAVIRMPDAAEDYARLLYSTLHRLDESGVGVIVVEAVPDDDAWSGIRDRLRRAAATTGEPTA